MRRRALFLGILQTMQPPQPVDSIGAHRMFPTRRKQPDASATVGRMLRGELTHQRHDRCLAHHQPQVMTQCRSGHRHQRARSSNSYRLPPPPQRYATCACPEPASVATTLSHGARRRAPHHLKRMSAGLWTHGTRNQSLVAPGQLLRGAAWYKTSLICACAAHNRRNIAPG